MKTFTRKEIWDRAVAVLGEWRTWDRASHIAYGLIRGTPYARMERYANDAPPTWEVTKLLYRLGAWPEIEVREEHLSYDLQKTPARDETNALIVWVRKPVRGKRAKAPEVVDEARG